MYLTRGGSVQRSLTSGPMGWPASQVLCLFSPWLCAHVCTQEGEGQGGGGRLAGHHLVGYHLNQVGNPSLDPYKYPSTSGNQKTHHILEIPLAKLPFLM
jgi:hypothetical protein